MDRVIRKAVFSTLAAIGILIVFLITVLVTFFPGNMMEITYDLGMEKASIHFAERAYQSSDDIYYAAFATETAINEGRTSKIVSCGEKFIADEDFDEYCAKKNSGILPEMLAENGGYEQYVYGQVCLAKYKQDDKEGAVTFAFGTLGNGFAKNNAVVALLVTAVTSNDGQVVTLIQDKLNKLQGCVGDDEGYLQSALSYAEGING